MSEPPSSPLSSAPSSLLSRTPSPQPGGGTMDSPMDKVSQTGDVDLTFPFPDPKPIDAGLQTSQSVSSSPDPLQNEGGVELLPAKRRRSAPRLTQAQSSRCQVDIEPPPKKRVKLSPDTSQVESSQRRVTPPKVENDDQPNGEMAMHHQGTPPNAAQDGPTATDHPTQQLVSTSKLDEDALANPKSPPCRRVAPTRVKEHIPAPADSPPPPVKRKAPVRGNWSVGHLMSNPRSKLATINLSELLGRSEAWTSLTREEQLVLIDMLPGASAPDMPDGEPLPNVARAYLKSNTALQADLRLFQEDLAAGRYEKEWLDDAQEASSKRANGDFDAWKEKHQEAFWGQKQKIAWNALAGDSSVHSLPTLVAAGYFQVGDTFLLQRGYRPGNGMQPITVEKEAKIKAISNSHTLSFTFPPGQAKFSAPAAGEDLQIDGVDGPIKLSNAILDEDGRIVGVRGANAWREFRCIRKNQDMGSLWDVCELYHHRQSFRKQGQ